MKKKIIDLFSKYNITGIEVDYRQPNPKRCCYFIKFTHQERENLVFIGYNIDAGTKRKLEKLKELEAGIMYIVKYS